MPCLNLTNTFAHWKSYKQAKAETVKTKTTQDTKEVQAPTQKPAKGLFAGPQDLRVPHPRAAKITEPATEKTEEKAVGDKPLIKALRPSVRMTRADLINAESKLGSTIFGPIPAGHRREFFHDRQNIWIWHEDWYDGQRTPHQMTVRYEVRTTGVYKKISTGKYFKLEGEELDNFRKATHAYLRVIKQNLYNQAKKR